MSRWLIVLVLGAAQLPGLVDAAGLVDPTRPPDVLPSELGGPAGADAPFVVSSILIAPNRRIAIVNGQRVRQGEEVSGAEVMEINAGGVQLKSGGEIFELRLTTSVKTAASSRQGAKP